MKRAWRWLFNFAAGVSVALCVAAMVLWMRSHRVLDGIGIVLRQSDVGHLRAISREGHVAFYVSLSTRENFAAGKERNRRGFECWSLPANDFADYTDQYFQQRDFGFHKSVDVLPDPQYADYYVRVPHWLLAALSGVLPAGWYAGYRRNAKRRGLGVCTTCGYDLRATPERCPECGAVTEQERNRNSAVSKSG